MKLIYGEELSLEDMTLREIRDLEIELGIHVILDGFEPEAIQIPCDLPGMTVILKLK